MKSSEQANPEETKSISGHQRLGGWEKWGVIADTRFLLGSDENVLELDSGGDAGTTL